jgi:hypothetical protein
MRIKKYVLPFLALFGAVACSSDNSGAGGSVSSSVSSTTSSSTSSSTTSSSSSGNIDGGCATTYYRPSGEVPCPGSFDLGFVQDDSPITYNGGPVMVSPINIYYIWYGDWTTKLTTAPIMEYAANNLSANSWYNINRGYYQETIDGGLVEDAGIQPDASGVSASFVSPNIAFGKSIYVGSPNGSTISPGQALTLIANAISSNQLPSDTNAQYFFLTSPEVDVFDGNTGDEFCYNYCAFHDSFDVNGIDIKYAIVGDPMACPDQCSAQPQYSYFGFTNSPNSDWDADSMMVTLMHESSEMATDPNPGTNVAWQSFQTNGSLENADMCSWVFGSLYLTTNGSVANTKIGNKDFLLQELWSRVNQKCLIGE